MPTINGTEITNTLTGKVNIEATKVWEDNENINSTRPENVTAIVIATSNGNTEVVAELELSELNQWKDSIELPKYDENGALIEYEVGEKELPEGYSNKVEGYTITNTINTYNYTVEYYYDGVKDETKTEFIPANYGEKINSYTDKIISGYKLDKVEGLGLVIEGNQEKDIIKVYYIRKDAKVKIKYIDQITGEPIAEEKTIDGKVHDKYEAESIEIENYELVGNTENTSGEMTEEEITVIYYYKHKAELEVQYIDKNTNTILDTNQTTGLEGDKVITEAKDILGYVLIESPETEEYNLTKDKQIVKYYYAKKSDVIVKYLEKSTNQVLANEEKIEGYIGKEYESSQKNIDGYTFIESTNNIKGTMTENQIIVIYYYAKGTSIKINYIDKNTNEILDTDTLQGLEGDTVNTSAKDIEGYVLSEKPSEEEYVLDRTAKVVNYYYVHTSEGVIEKHIDINTNELLEDVVTHKGYEGDTYNISSKEFEGYDLVKEKLPSNSKGVFTKELIEVKYYYIYNSKVEVKYVDKYTGEEIDTDEITGHENDKYSVKPKDISNYKLDTGNLPQNSEGTMTKDKITVTYYLINESQGIESSYVDKITGEEIASKEYIEGYEGDFYSTKTKEIEGYTLVEIPNNSTGTMTKEKIEVIYYYLKNTSVEVKYVDETGKEILDTEIKPGKVFDLYEIETKTIYGYELIEVPENSTGTMTEDKITVTYVYKLKNTSVEIKYIDENGKELSDTKIIEGKVFDEYKTEEKEISGYELVEIPTNKKGTMTEDKIIVEYIYKLKETKVETKYIDENGNEISKIEVNPGKVDDEYKTEPKEIPGYELVKIPQNSEGQMTEETIQVTYSYRKLLFDIGITKDVEKITQGDKTTKIDNTDSNKLIKIEVDAKKISNEEIKIYYTLKIRNNGEVAGTVGKVTDYIPEGLEFVAEDNENYWVLTNGAIETEFLKDCILQPGEETTLRVVLRWKNGENNMGVKERKAIISSLTNEFGFEDIVSENNESNAKIMIAIKTGAEEAVNVSIILAIFASLSVVIFELRKNIK